MPGRRSRSKIYKEILSRGYRGTKLKAPKLPSGGSKKGRRRRAGY